uniref:Uncharacterized protein n=1 Tax=Arundo donax TaxID=35708 RepID=A0A0A9A534_ARUDO
MLPLAYSWTLEIKGTACNSI